MFREKKLYNPSLIDCQISDILNFWIKGEKLIPPTILVIDRTIKNTIKDTDKIFPVDGKHRLNVAYYLGCTKIPIFVINKQLDKIKSILNLK